MHILVTTDTVTGVWTYTRELVTSLVTSGIRVTLVSFGDVPLPEQTAWMEPLHGLDYRPTGFRLEWMHEAREDYQDSRSYLTRLVQEIKPDVLHLGQYCYGDLAVDVPRIVVANGDLIGWWVAVHGHEPAKADWLEEYRELVSRGITGATAVVAPSRWMLQSLRRHYVAPERELVIYNGRNPIYFNPYTNKDDCVLAVGRFRDAAKQVTLLTQHSHPLPVCIVGSDSPANQFHPPIRADVKLAVDETRVSFKGPQSEAQLRSLYSRSAIYAATSRYESFGMAALEAALSRCAIVANDIPVFREIWGDAAIYFETNSGHDLAETIRVLKDDRDLCRAYGNLAYQRARERFTAKRMVEQYLQLYRHVIKQTAAA